MCRFWSYPRRMDIYLLWHAHHADDRDGRARHQQTLDGDWFCDEQAGDDAKLLGLYSTQDKANVRVEQARTLPGFQEEPECFLVDRYEVDVDGWTTGYVRM